MSARRWRAAVRLLAGIACAATSAAAQRAPAGGDVRLPWSLVRLENGLTLLMHRDASVPDVSVDVWMRGGSREEAPGHYGIAHLFEHNLPTSSRFLGNAENRRRFGEAMRASGAGTDPDFLRFYLQGAPSGLEYFLGALADRLESDTTRFLADQLARDQNIVVNELRRAVDVDWDPELRMRLARGTFGAEHPYGHAVSGTEEDVRAATPELMREWHRRFAGASNVVVLVMGNFDPARAEAGVRRHFASITPGTRVPRVEEWIPEPRAIREAIEKDVGRGVVFLSWPAPAWGSADGDRLALFARILGRRVMRRAATGSALAAASASVELREIAGSFTVRGEAAGTSADSAEAVLRSELERLARDGPSETELVRAKSEWRTEYVRALQQLAGRSDGRTDVLGLGLLFRGDPDHYRVQLARIGAATAHDVRETGHRWLQSSGYVMHVLPRGRLAAAAPYDRAATVEPPGDPRPAAYPAIRDTTLGNGLRLLVVERPQLPLVELTIAFRAGGGTDDPGNPGRAESALEALTRTPVGGVAVTLADSLAALGAQLRTRVDPDFAVLSISMLSDRLPHASAALATALAAERPEPMLRASARAVAARRGSEADPMRARERLARCMREGDGRCADGPARGPSTETDPDDLRAFILALHRPDNAVLAASGSLGMRTLLDSPLAAWVSRDSMPLALPADGPPARPAAGGAKAVEFPGATQTHILLVQPLPAETAKDPVGAELVMWALRQRLMQNLRTAKGWSYEVYPFAVETHPGDAVMRFNIPVQSEQTAESVGEVLAEIHRMRDSLVDDGYLASIRGIVEGGLTSGLRSLAEMNAQLLELARNDLPPTYYAEWLRRLPEIGPVELQTMARAMLDPDRILWAIAGERTTLRRELGELGLANVEILNATDVP